MITFKQFLIETRTLYHSTTDEGFANIELRGFQAQAGHARLFPNSVSFTLRPNEYGGRKIIKVKLNVQDKDILYLTMKEFWSKAESSEEITPLKLGERWVAQAKADDKSVIIIKGVPGIGTEVCVLDTSLILNTKLE